jgi:hypothetical protein
MREGTYTHKDPQAASVLGVLLAILKWLPPK